MKIAVGKNRFDVDWKNNDVAWEKFVDRLRKPIVTQETSQDYLAYTKTQQDTIKDVGGYVGGSVTGGQRKLKSIVTRDMFTLDADFANDNILQRFVDTWGCCCAAHSTRKDRPGSRRVRIVGPYSRPCTPEEHEAVSRLLAAKVGMDMFDDTTYQPHRLMYWPSVSCDQSYYIEQHDGNLLDVDAVLASYGPKDAWRDTSLWPESSRVLDGRRKSADKQGNPLEKPGLVGAFCRTYTIEQAMAEFLPGAYEPATTPGRFTYTEGSTFGGAILYDDMFLYSNHATDPISGMLCNAFDLVRVHKFGDADHDKSMKAMSEWCLTVDAIRQTVGEERLAKAQEDFAESEAIQDNSWLKKIEYNRLGAAMPTPRNVRLIMTHDAGLAGALQFDEFTDRVRLLHHLPWRRVDDSHALWTDADDACLRNYLHTQYGIKGKDVVSDVLTQITMENTIHPVRDYLKSLSWDCIDRVDTVLIDYLGAEDNDYVREVTRKMLVAAVARIFEPGCKFDNMLVLVGPQGIGKSTLLRQLSKGWFNDSVKDMRGKSAYEAIQGTWFVEFGELAAQKRSEVEEVKGFLSAQSDSFRAAYGRRVTTYQRQCVFFGTTNEYTFLQDDTGNRRFWPVTVEGKDRRLTEYEIDQIWAEAVEMYKAKESLELPKHLIEQAQAKQVLHTWQSEKTGLVMEYLDKHLPVNWYAMDLAARREFLSGGLGATLGENEPFIIRECTCVMEIWRECFYGDPKNLNRISSNEIAGILKKSGTWAKGATSRFGEYGAQKGFIRIV